MGVQLFEKMMDMSTVIPRLARAVQDVGVRSPRVGPVYPVSLRWKGGSRNIRGVPSLAPSAQTLDWHGSMSLFRLIEDVSAVDGGPLEWINVPRKDEWQFPAKCEDRSFVV